MFRAFLGFALFRGLEAYRAIVDLDGNLTGDCSWAHIDVYGGWICSTEKAFSAGKWGITKLVEVTPKRARNAIKAVLKTTSSNERDGALDLLRNEKEVAQYLQSKRFTGMPRYRFDFPVQAKYYKYTNHESMTLSQCQSCDQQMGSSGICAINPSWTAANQLPQGKNFDTVSEGRNKQLACPDSEALLLDYLDGYQDIEGFGTFITKEAGFRREVRAASFILAYDGLHKLQVSHCDLNAGNVMFKLDDPTEMKIIDYGLALLNDPTAKCGDGSGEGAFEFREADLGSGGLLWSLYDKISGGQSFMVGGETWPTMKDSDVSGWEDIVGYANKLVAKCKEIGC